MPSVNMCIRIDSNLKKQAEDVLSQLGMTMSGTINMFLTQIVREKAVPCFGRHSRCQRREKERIQGL